MIQEEARVNPRGVSQETAFRAARSHGVTRLTQSLVFAGLVLRLAGIGYE
jgi:hypothetical protein